jgi:Chalcone isomerase-like
MLPAQQRGTHQLTGESKMKLSHLFVALFALAYMPSAFAGILTTEDGAVQIDGLSVSKGGKLVVDGRSNNLVTVGAGLRKKFGIISVYVGEFLVNDNKKYVCQADKAFDSLKNLSAVAMRLRFVYTVGASDLVKAYKDGFDANDVDYSKGTVKQFLDAATAGGGVSSGQEIVVAGEKLADGSEVVTLESADGKVVSVKGTAGFVHDVFSLWLGATADGGAEALKQNIVNCKIQ